MSFWVLVATFSASLGGGLIDVDLFYTKVRCEEMVKFLTDRGISASCQLVTVKQ